VQDPILGIQPPSLVFNKQVACFNATCCYDPNAQVQDPCLWEALDIPNFLLNYYSPYNSSEASGVPNILSDLQNDYFGRSYDCGITDTVGCPQDFDKPSATDSTDKIRAFLAFIAIRRQLMYTRGVYNYMNTVFKDAIRAIPGNNNDGIVAQFVDNTKPVPKDDSSDINTGKVLLHC
jgi:hypothetical protein